jgi:6-phosphogluconolactonase
MRKSLIGIGMSVSLALLAAACSDDDDAVESGGAGAPSAGKSNGGAAAGGTASAEAPNGGSSAGGENAAGEPAKGGAPGAAGAEPSASAGEAGMGGDAPVEVTTANAVYTMTNNADANRIVGFLRSDDGSLEPMSAPFPTGGKGSGAGLGEQGAVAYDLENDRLYVVNAGDHSFSIFAVNDDGSLGAAEHVTTAGFGAGAASLLAPKSITFRGEVVYVLFQGNATTASKIAGWKVAQSAGAELSAVAIAGSDLALSSESQSVDPAQVSFSPDGKWLVVTEKQSGSNGTVAGDGSIDTFSVSAAGLATKKGFYPTAPAPGGGLQKVPFGFDFVAGYLIVSEAGSTGTGSYSYANGVVAPVATSQFLPTDPAPCWVIAAGNFAYVTNTRGPNISGFVVSAAGALSNIGPIENAIVASTGKTIAGENGPMFQGPTDEIVSQDGKYLYALNAAVPSIGIFEIADNGTLARVGAGDYSPPELAQLPTGSVGIVAR